MIATAEPALLDAGALRQAFGHFPTGVSAVCARGDGGPVGMAVSAFVPVSLDPPLVAICLQTGSSTWPLLRALPRIGVSVLAAGHAAAARGLAARGADRFNGVDYTTTPEGAIRIDGSSAWFDCSLDQEIDAGDHVLALLRIHNLELGGDEIGPLVFHRSRFSRVTLVPVP